MMKTVKPSQLELEQPPSREALLQDQVAAIAASERAREILKDEDFDWNTDDAVILKEQRATAVYHNKMGELIVRQKADWDEEGDTFIFVTPENFNAFIDGIAARIRQGGGA
jgi:hypothetical protein